MSFCEATRIIKTRTWVKTKNDETNEKRERWQNAKKYIEIEMNVIKLNNESKKLNSIHCHDERRDWTKAIYCHVERREWNEITKLNWIELIKRNEIKDRWDRDIDNVKQCNIQHESSRRENSRREIHWKFLDNCL